MTAGQVQKYFKKYVLPPRGMIYRDIQREIELARDGKGGGELLSAIALLSYTEFMGKLMLSERESYTKQFRAFFRSMGEQYQNLVDNREIDVYRLFRSGLVQSYFDGDCEIKMLNDEATPSGIVVREDGTYLFTVEKYFQDFITACQALYEKKRASTDEGAPPA